MGCRRAPFARRGVRGTEYLVKWKEPGEHPALAWRPRSTLLHEPMWYRWEPEEAKQQHHLVTDAVRARAGPAFLPPLTPRGPGLPVLRRSLIVAGGPRCRAGQLRGLDRDAEAGARAEPADGEGGRPGGAAGRRLARRRSHVPGACSLSGVTRLAACGVRQLSAASVPCLTTRVRAARACRNRTASAPPLRRARTSARARRPSRSRPRRTSTGSTVR